MAGRLGEVFFFSSAQSMHRLVCHRRGGRGGGRQGYSRQPRRRRSHLRTSRELMRLTALQRLRDIAARRCRDPNTARLTINRKHTPNTHTHNTCRLTEISARVCACVGVCVGVCECGMTWPNAQRCIAVPRLSWHAEYIACTLRLCASHTH